MDVVLDTLFINHNNFDLEFHYHYLINGNKIPNAKLLPFLLFFII